MAPPIPRLDLRLDDLERVVERARHTPLSDDEYATLKAAIATLGYVAQLVEQKGTTIAGLRQILFGARTEKTRDRRPALGGAPGASRRVRRPAPSGSRRSTAGHAPRTPAWRDDTALLTWLASL